MKIHEYQGKDIFRNYGIPVPDGIACFTADEARAAAEKLAGDKWVVKAQIHAGGRGKGGGVKLASSLDEVSELADQILGMNLITHQTGPAGQQVRRLLIERGAAIKSELYAGLVVDRTRQKIALMASAEGGVDIERVAVEEPDKIKTIWADPESGFDEDEAKQTAASIGLPASAHAQFADMAAKLHKIFVDLDAALCEINPLVVTESDDLIALDSKINFDSSALFRQPKIVQLRDEDEEDPAEREAAKHDLSYIALDGNIGCMVNGAGLAMATMDIIKLYGGEPANFLDVGGGASKEKVQAAFELMLANPSLAAILVNIFGGIMRCDVIAEGIVAAAQATEMRIPLVVRLEGTNVKQGKEILAKSGLAIIAAASMDDAASKVVDAAGTGKQ